MHQEMYLSVISISYFLLIIFSQCTFYIMAVNQNTEINYVVQYYIEVTGI
jgi:hypothetical protein